MAITYRVIDQSDELEQVVDLEIIIWGLSPRDAVPSSLFHALLHNGGVLIGAFDNAQLVGLSFGFPARQPRTLWSHMTGTHPDYQSCGVGFGLKQYQRTWALEHGYRYMRWTFDPLQRRNAHFNLCKLGASANIYHENYYGTMLDGINAGLPSDRLEVVWNLKARAASSACDAAQEMPFLVEADDAMNLSCTQPDTEVAVYGVEIPFDLPMLKQQHFDKAAEWQLTIRQTLQAAFARGYQITGFVTAHERCWYVLSAPEAWFMYVVECRDGSLYTGITNHLERRIQQHNRGKGAAYTASRRPVKLLGAWRFVDRTTALKAEAAFKQNTRKVKQEYLRSKSTYRDGVFVEPS